MLSVKGLCKTFIAGRREVRAVVDVSFDVPDGEFFTFLGPSGSGKSTIIRCIAGLERPEAGEISVGERTVFSHKENLSVPTYKRDIAMVFQSYAIWPNMTVFRNVAYPLEGKAPKGVIRERVSEVLKLVGIDHLADRPAPQLSGGQQQRVALARAIIKGAKLLLLDEPLSNLDAKLRAHMRAEIKDLQKKLGITAIYVTHDQEEALSLSDRLAIINQGRIVEVGDPASVYRWPSLRFSAEFVGGCNILPGRIVRRGEREAVVETAIGRIVCTGPVTDSEKVVACVRPEHIALLEEGERGSDAANVFKGVVASVAFLGRFLDCRVLVGGLDVNVHASSLVRIETGQEVLLYFAPEACMVFAER